MANPVVEITVEGMDCANCANSITRFLERKGLEDVYVNFQTKEVRFRQGAEVVPFEVIKAGIHKLGYTVVEEDTAAAWWTLERKLIISALFTLPLVLQHVLMAFGKHISFMHSPWVQLLLCLPVFVLGAWHFGRSAWSSLREGVPNMDVLIFIGGTAAFVYSLAGLLLGEADYIFFETSASIFTLVFLGNWIEHKAVEQTTSAIGELTRLQVEKARRIMPSGVVLSVNHDEIETGFELQVNEGDKIPADGTILAGSATIDQSMLTGESIPVEKLTGDTVFEGALVLSGNIRINVTATGKNSILGQMIELVKTAQQDKPAIQRLADQISAVFVPVVVGISVLTFLLSYFGFGAPFQQSLMNSIAVLVISCPCAMGLATPTAVMVGVGRLARNGILIKGGQTLESFSNIRKIVFDKTGTLTTGQFSIDRINYHTPDHHLVHDLVYHLEKHSSHPLAHSLVEAMAERLNDQNGLNLIVQESKGLGVMGRDAAGNLYRVGSRRTLPDFHSASPGASVFLTRNEALLAEFFIKDEIKPGAQELIRHLRSQGIEPIVLSGDNEDKTAAVAAALGIPTHYSEQLPEEKLRRIEQLSLLAPTAMVGDGINDAPALAKATIGISLSNASNAAIQSAQIVLLNGRLEYIGKALAISKHTVLTIKQSLFWAFAYNIVAIPMAAMGYLNPMWGALFMAFSDIVVVGNAIRLRHKWIEGVGRS